MKIRIKRKSLFIFSYLIAMLWLFMFYNRDVFFNINNYRNLLFFIVGYGLLLVIFKMIKNKRLLGIPSVLIILCWTVLLNSKYILRKKAEPYYIMFIVALLLYLLCMAELEFDIYIIRFLVNAYILSAVIMSVIILVQHKTPYAQYGIFRWALFYGQNEYYDVNFTSLYLLMPAILSFYGAVSAKNQNRWKYMICVGLILLAIMMLGSRGTFAPVIAIMAFLVLKGKKNFYA